MGRTVLAIVVLLAVLVASPATAVRFPFAKGDLVTVEGVIDDGTGSAPTDLEIVLEASRRKMTMRPFGRNKKDIVQGGTRPDAFGKFGLEWNWSPKYNHYELLVTVRVVDPGGTERLEILERLDITKKVAAGNPVALLVTIEDTAYLTELREFKATLESADQKRVYREAGRPDRVDRVDVTSRVEVAWWFFRVGKVYRFVDGRLDGVEDFTPVEPI